jgi:hypothetical protein
MKPPRFTNPEFVYVPSQQTDIRKTFERVRARLHLDRGMASDLRGADDPAVAARKASKLFGQHREDPRESCD